MKDASSMNLSLFCEHPIVPVGFVTVNPDVQLSIAFNIVSDVANQNATLPYPSQTIVLPGYSDTLPLIAPDASECSVPFHLGCPETSCMASPSEKSSYVWCILKGILHISKVFFYISKCILP